MTRELIVSSMNAYVLPLSPLPYLVLEFNPYINSMTCGTVEERGTFQRIVRSSLIRAGLNQTLNDFCF